MASDGLVSPAAIPRPVSAAPDPLVENSVGWPRKAQRSWLIPSNATTTSPLRPLKTPIDGVLPEGPQIPVGPVERNHLRPVGKDNLRRAGGERDADAAAGHVEICPGLTGIVVPDGETAGVGATKSARYSDGHLLGGERRRGQSAPRRHAHTERRQHRQDPANHVRSLLPPRGRLRCSLAGIPGIAATSPQIPTRREVGCVSHGLRRRSVGREQVLDAFESKTGPETANAPRSARSIAAAVSGGSGEPRSIVVRTWTSPRNAIAQSTTTRNPAYAIAEQVMAAARFMASTVDRRVTRRSSGNTAVSAVTGDVLG